jgi:superoxide dismutase, Fe-Mn family
MAFTLPELPYEMDGLMPYMSAETISFHYEKHHKGYVDKLNKLVAGTEQADAALEEVIMDSSEEEDMETIFNNAAQVWNHNFFWHSMKPGGGGAPTGDIADLIDRDFGSHDEFVAMFTEAATAHFGSGWAWLVMDDDKLAIMTTENADMPMLHDATALLTCDLWEHAYYLDHQNRRPDFIKAYLENLINWDFANANLAEVDELEDADDA